MRNARLATILLGGANKTSVADTFTATNATLLDAHAPDNYGGDLPFWLPDDTSKWQITGNKAYPSVLSAASRAFVVTDIFRTVTNIEVDITLAAAYSSGIVWRYKDANNFFMAQIGSNLIIYERTNGTFAARATSTHTVTGGHTYHLRVSISGNTFTASVYDAADPATVVTASYTSVNLASWGRAGLRDSNTGDRHDNFSITGYLRDLPSASVSEMGAALEWFQKPAAVRFDGTHDRTYISWINHSGVVQCRYYDHGAGAWSSIVDVDDLTSVNAAQAVDDHNPPQMYISATGIIHLRYAVHDVNNSMFQKISTNAEDISAWGERTTISDGAATVYNYPQVKRVTDGTLLMFYRVGPFNAATEVFKSSTDGGATWGSPTTLIDHGAGYGVYAFVDVGGNNIHVAWNYQDASAGKRFDIYYMYSEDAGANWKKRDGTAITLPASPSNADLVYDSGTDQAYCWDIRIDGDGGPVIVFATKDDPNHEYRYAHYHDDEWSTHQITTSQTLYWPLQNFYSPGVVIDPVDVNTVYVAKKQTQTEIEKWSSADSGATWELSEQITTGSYDNNYRPQVVENYTTGLRLIWMNGFYTGVNSGEWNGYGRVYIQSEITKNGIPRA